MIIKNKTKEKYTFKLFLKLYVLIYLGGFMKKRVKIILIIIVVLVGYIAIDLTSVYTRKKPIFSFASSWFIRDSHDEINKVYFGLLYDVYNCEQYSTPQIKVKWTKYSCPTFTIKTSETDGNGWFDGEINEVENVSMTIKDGTLTSTKATIIITDLNEQKYTYGAYFRIDIKENGIWKEAKKIGNANFNDIAYIVEKNNKMELSQDWSYIYGNLKKGNYRLVKYILTNEQGTPVSENDKAYFSIGFTIK